MTLGPAVEMRSAYKFYGDFHALKDVNLTVDRGKKIVVCGPSGLGKSTMIRTINQLEVHQAGTILINGCEINADAQNIEEMRREVGMCFQHFNLFSHLTILENRRDQQDPKLLTISLFGDQKSLAANNVVSG